MKMDLLLLLNFRLDTETQTHPKQNEKDSFLLNNRYSHLHVSKLMVEALFSTSNMDSSFYNAFFMVLFSFVIVATIPSIYNNFRFYKHYLLLILCTAKLSLHF